MAEALWYPQGICRQMLLNLSVLPELRGSEKEVHSSQIHRVLISWELRVLIRITGFKTLALPFVSLLTLGMSLILSEFQFPLLENREIVYLIKLL